MKTEKILYVINPVSGSADHNYKSYIKEYSSEFGYEYKIYETTGNDDVKKIKEHLADFEPDKVIAAGGDGTINIVASMLINTEVKLGIIPSGSANGLAYSLDIPTRFKEALRYSIEGAYKAIDVILINDKHYCIHLGDIGINARIVKRFEKEGSKGLLGYGKQLFKELFSPKTYFSYNITTADTKKRSKAEMLVIGNANSYGTGVKINPYGQIDDGKFEVVVIKPYPWWFIFTFIFSGFTGHLHKRQHVDVYSTEKAEIQLDREHDFQIDGEVRGKTKYLKLQIIPNALIVPRV